MVGAVAALEAPANRKLQARIGIATGVVVVGDPSSTEVGETPNLAARLQGLATAGSSVMAESTKALVGDLK
jgi:class 3 adenylate cyclase